MPTIPLCAKCRQGPCFESDSWCIACTGLEAIGVELSGNWLTQSHRAIAEDLVVSTTRAIKALRNLSGGLRSAGDSLAANSAEAKNIGADKAVRLREKSQLPAPPPPPPKVVKEQAESSEAEEEESEEEEEDEVEHRVKRSRSPVPLKAESASRHRDRSRHRHRSRKEAKELDTPRSSGYRGSRGEPRLRHSFRGVRAGSRHQRVYRTLNQPDLRVHRQLPGRFWESKRPLAGR